MNCSLDVISSTANWTSPGDIVIAYERMSNTALKYGFLTFSYSFYC